MKERVQKIHSKLDTFPGQVQELENSREVVAKRYLNSELDMNKAIQQLIDINNEIDLLRKEEEATYNLLGLVKKVEE